MTDPVKDRSTDAPGPGPERADAFGARRAEAAADARMAAEDEFRRAGNGRDGPMSVTMLFRRLIDDVATLFRKEVAMATSEILHSMHDVKSGVGGMIGGAAVLYAGVLILLLAGVFGLAEVMETWAAALVVGGAAALLGLIMLQVSKRKVEPRHFAPEHAARAIRKDKDMIERQTR
jgi:hypothetical protein